MGQTGFCKILPFPAVFCAIPRFPAVFCEDLRVPALFFLRKEAQQKTAKVARFVFFSLSLLLPLERLRQNCVADTLGTFGGL